MFFFKIFLWGCVGGMYQNIFTRLGSLKTQKTYLRVKVNTFFAIATTMDRKSTHDDRQNSSSFASK